LFIKKYKKRNRWKSLSGKGRYNKWRRSVFELNYRKYGYSKHYVCVKCSKKRKTTRVLHAHHIYSWNNYPNRRYSIQNGVVMCKYCHNKFHNKYKFEALDKPELLLEYLSNDKNVKKYIKKA